MNQVRTDSTYTELTPYQRQCLPATNYWRQQNGESLIDVPEADEHYHRNFNRRMIPRNDEIVVRPDPTPIPTFSFFYMPVENITNTKPINLAQLHEAITGNYFKEATIDARELIKKSRKEYYDFKIKKFHYVTFSGQFKKRNSASLIKHSGLLCLDLDHLPDVHAMRERLLGDTTVSTELLFISPSGDGLKWVVSIDINEASHLSYFFAFQNYVEKTHGVKIDGACKDVSRACLIPHDPNAYINPKWLTVLS
ncbi:MAG: hypothetical protein EHM20_00705 [Alphaproteobacteria bacterium]|nr:MAG: hypothetical protein EHM20_00705 [Alphaproteobacteria bacterium]